MDGGRTRISVARVGLVAGALASVMGLVVTGWAIAAPAGTPSAFTSIVPCRLVDTRAGAQIGPRGTPLDAHETVTFQVRGANGQCDIPANATGIISNVTIDNATGSSFLTVFPSDAAQPLSSNLNWTAESGATPNQVTVGLSADGAISLYNDAATVNVVIDVVGYFSDTSAPSPPTQTLLDFDASWGPAALAGNNGITILTPPNCRTEPYLAGVGESALVNISATGSPTADANDVLYLDVMVSQNDGPFATVLAGYSADSMTSGTASPSTTKVIDLVAGTTYVFAAGFSSKAAVNINAGYCQGSALITRTS